MSQETILLGLMLITFLGLVAGLKWPVGLSLAATSVGRPALAPDHAAH